MVYSKVCTPVVFIYPGFHLGKSPRGCGGGGGGWGGGGGGVGGQKRVGKHFEGVCIYSGQYSMLKG